MSQIQYICKHVTILNTLLLSAVILMANYFLIPFLYSDMTYTPPLQKKGAAIEAADQSHFDPPSPTDYLNIAEDNIFHPERRIPPEKKVEPELPKPDFVLYGTMVSDDLHIAYLEDLKAPRSTPGRGKRQMAIKKGDMFSGFTLKEVETDKIVMTRGEEKMTVQLIDPHKPKQRAVSASIGQQTATAQAAGREQQHKTAQQAPAEIKASLRPKEAPDRPPPRSEFESTVRGFFDRSK